MARSRGFSPAAFFVSRAVCGRVPEKPPAFLKPDDREKGDQTKEGKSAEEALLAKPMQRRGEPKVGEQLKALREAIDQVDVDILALFNKRMELCQEVGRTKAANGLTLFDPGREEKVIERLLRINSGPLCETSLRAIYREIFAASRRLQRTTGGQLQCRRS